MNTGWLTEWAEKVHPVRATIALALVGALIAFKFMGIAIDAEFYVLGGLAVGFYLGNSA